MVEDNTSVPDKAKRRTNNLPGGSHDGLVAQVEEIFGALPFTTAAMDERASASSEGPGEGTPHTVVSAPEVQINTALEYSASAGAFDAAVQILEEPPPDGDSTSRLIYLEGHGQLGKIVDEGNRLAGTDGTQAQRAPDGGTPTDEAPHSHESGTVIYNHGKGKLATRVDRQTDTRFAQQRRPAGTSVPQSLRVSRAFGQGRPSRRFR